MAIQTPVRVQMIDAGFTVTRGTKPVDTHIYLGTNGPDRIGLANLMQAMSDVMGSYMDSGGDLNTKSFTLAVTFGDLPKIE